MIIFDRKKNISTQDIIDFIGSNVSNQCMQLNFFGCFDESEITGTDIYMTILYSDKMEITDNLVTTIILGKIFEVNTTCEELKNKLLETNNFYLDTSNIHRLKRHYHSML